MTVDHEEVAIRFPKNWKKFPIAGIDLGASYTDYVFADSPTDVVIGSLPAELDATPTTRIEQAFAAGGKRMRDIPHIAITGGKSRSLKDAEYVVVNEFQAIGFGGRALADIQEPAVVVSCGTGSACVFVGKKNHIEHQGGTGMGGGTLIGLGFLLTGTRNAEDLLTLARRGNSRLVNLTVGEIIGGGIGALSPNTTAASFARGQRTDLTRADLAAGLVRMVAENIAKIALTSMQANGCKKIIFGGRLAPAVSDFLYQIARDSTAALSEATIIAPDYPQIISALGALAYAQSKG